MVASYVSAYTPRERENLDPYKCCASVMGSIRSHQCRNKGTVWYSETAEVPDNFKNKSVCRVHDIVESKKQRELKYEEDKKKKERLVIYCNNILQKAIDGDKASQDYILYALQDRYRSYR